MQPKRSAADWYHDAVRAYAEQHQGCAWCGGAHRVRQAVQGVKHIFSCQRCDFQVSFDAHANRFQLVPGEQLATVSETMLEQPIAHLLS